VTVHRVKFLIIKPTRCTNFSCFLGMKLYMFRVVPLSIIMSFLQYTQQFYISYRSALLCVQWKIHDDRQGNCPKHVEFHSKNKFEKLTYLVGFIMRNIFCSLYPSNVFLLVRTLLFVGKKPQFPISSVLVSLLLSLMSPASAEFNCRSYGFHLSIHRHHLEAEAIILSIESNSIRAVPLILARAVSC
jgi:hypothetical protein